jgi:hypothetical protein
METLSDILAAILFLSPIWLIIALIKPSLFKLKSRWHLALIYPAFVVVIMLGFSFSVPDKTPEQIAAETAQIEQQEKELPKVEKILPIKAEEPKKTVKKAVKIPANENNSPKNIDWVIAVFFKEMTKAERIKRIRNAIKSWDKSSSIIEGKVFNFSHQLTNDEFTAFYNAIVREVLLLSSQDIQKVYMINIFNNAIEKFNAGDREWRSFDTVMDEEKNIMMGIENYIDKQIPFDSSFEINQIDKRLNTDSINYTVTYRYIEKNDIGGSHITLLHTEQMTADFWLSNAKLIE